MSQVVFSEYVEKHVVEEQIKLGNFAVGSLRINPRNYEDAFVTVNSKLPDVIIKGLVARNRGLQDDVVALDYYPMETWNVFSDRVISHISSAGFSQSQIRELLLPQMATHWGNSVISKDKNWEVSEEPSLENLSLTHSTRETSQTSFSLDKREFDPKKIAVLLGDTFVQKTAQVVFILKYVHTRKALGKLKKNNNNNNNSNSFVFHPLDSRIPRMRISGQEVPKTSLNTLFVAQIKVWTHFLPLGKLIKCLENQNVINNFVEGLLMEANIDFEEFSESLVSSIPDKINEKKDEEEIRKRRDFRSECVFTIDPSTARDLDDAISLSEPDENGLIRVGVHIADVSHFVKEGSELDNIASDRGTSVYLPHKVIPMLPRRLSENLCSLTRGETCYTFSVEWTFDKDGNILNTWFGKSLIRSACQLSYESAQKLIENKEISEPLEPPWTTTILGSKVRRLHRLASQLRELRRVNGALRLNSPKIHFSFDNSRDSPNGFFLASHTHSNHLIEEFMLLANTSVAQVLVEKFPRHAVLRRHPPPKSDILFSTNETLKPFGICLEGDSSSYLQSFLTSYEEQNEIHTVLLHYLMKPMQLAEYFIAGKQEDGSSSSSASSYYTSHYALSIPYYTHFTSPIRRYPDILVHRCLEAALNSESLDHWNHSELVNKAENCNNKRLLAKQVSTKTDIFFLQLFIRQIGRLDNIFGVILEVKDYSCDVIILCMGIVKRVYMDNCSDLESYSFRKANGKSELHCIWKGSKGQQSTLHIFSKVPLSLLKRDDSESEILVLINGPK